MNLLIYGAGGHGKVVATAARETLNYKNIFFLDPGKEHFKFLNKDKVFYLNPNHISSIRSDNPDSILAIGDNNIRMKIAREHPEDNFISITSLGSYISDFSEISKGVFVAAGAIINSDAFIGIHSIINTGSIIEHDCKIGNFCHIGPNAALGGNVALGSNVLIGGGSFVNPNITICSDVVIGSGSVVIDDVNEAGVYVGSPVKRIK